MVLISKGRVFTRPFLFNKSLHHLGYDVEVVSGESKHLLNDLRKDTLW